MDNDELRSEDRLDELDAFDELADEELEGEDDLGEDEPEEEETF